jgi:hypothetical protein
MRRSGVRLPLPPLLNRTRTRPFAKIQLRLAGCFRLFFRLQHFAQSRKLEDLSREVDARSHSQCLYLHPLSMPSFVRSSPVQYASSLAGGNPRGQLIQSRFQAADLDDEAFGPKGSIPAIEASRQEAQKHPKYSREALFRSALLACINRGNPLSVFNHQKSIVFCQTFGLRN